MTVRAGTRDRGRDQLIAGEEQVLAALSDGRWQTAAELAGATGLVPLAVRSMLKELARRRLARRSFVAATLGAWQITNAGAARTADRRERSC